MVVADQLNGLGPLAIHRAGRACPHHPKLCANGVLKLMLHWHPDTL